MVAFTFRSLAYVKVVLAIVSEISMNVRLLVEKATFFLLSKTEASLNREKKAFSLCVNPSVLD